jgi:Tol biopolymer transport system component/tRNA A-37 threonylcarbamoyl transferase component Bud32
MSLAPGSKIGHYEVLSKIGAGGMGEVYKARDSKLNREVAVKILPEALAFDTEYLSRFQREAQSLAAINHPNIATIFGLEQNAIVMELIDGQPLHGPLPPSEVTNIALQIAEALEAAHDKGIIHRDLKPANILLTPNGQVKILDFGLAKAVERSNETDRTLTLQSTQAGLILGTAAYMSPEQAAGKPVDRRADIWSFGVILHELLTGQKLFDGESVSHTLAEVLKSEIDFKPIPEGPLRQLLQRCLDRNLKTRLQHIGEARILLTQKPRPQQTNWRLPAACLAVTTLAIAWALFRTPAGPTANSATLELTPPPGIEFAAVTDGGGSAISPDGKTLAFVGIDQNGEESLYIRPLDSLVARPLPGTQYAARPFWSPDSKSIAFVAGGKLKRTDIAGGLPVALADVIFARGGSWNADGVILFADTRGQGILKIPAAGGGVSLATKENTQAGEDQHYFPHFLPDGKNFLLLIRHGNNQGKNHVALASLDGTPPVKLASTLYKPSYNPQTRSLLYISSGNKVVSQRLELNPPRITGDPIEICDGVGTSLNNAYANFSVSNDGVFFYARGGGTDTPKRFAWRDRDGKLSAPIGPATNVRMAFSISPVGSHVAYYSSSKNPSGNRGDVWVMDLASGLTSRFPTKDGLAPYWSPDGKSIYYTDNQGIQRKAADGSGEATQIWKGTRTDFIQSIAPDGKSLLFGFRELYHLPLDGTSKPTPMGIAPTSSRSAAISPDGVWVAFQSDESGHAEIYIQRLKDATGKRPVSSGGGHDPAWRGDGRELFWIGAAGRLAAAAVTSQGDDLKIAPPEALFVVDGPPGQRLFKPARDGKRFPIPIPVDGAEHTLPMVVRLNKPN